MEHGELGLYYAEPQNPNWELVWKKEALQHTGIYLYFSCCFILFIYFWYSCWGKTASTSQASLLWTLPVVFLGAVGSAKRMQYSNHKVPAFLPVWAETPR